MLEQKETIEPDLLEQVAKAMKVPVEAIKNFDEEKVINIFSNTYHDNSSILGTYHFNPIEKIVELYEALVKSEKEKVEMWQRLFDEKK